MITKSKYILPIGLIVFLLASCTTKKQLTYMHNLEQTEEGFNIKPPQYRVQKQDILYINIKSINNEINALFQTQPMEGRQMFQNETSLYINGYVVDDSGKVEMPLLGLIPVEGLTLDEIKVVIRDYSKVYLKEASIDIKLISFKFTVLGEVKKPDTYKNFNNQLTVFEAIGMAGDITDAGDRKNVLVVRPSPEGTKTYRIDLSKKEVLNSEAFFLMPNDVVIVEPVRAKAFRANIPNFSLALSTITTLILLLNYIK
ncbi:MAG: polysaccharide biosynthesis/export family protein [Bacteroidales bacterium]